MKVIVTRPRTEADAWVQQLRALHFDAVALPLIHIGSPEDKQAIIEAWKNLHQYSAVMFVSSNAVRYFFLPSMHLTSEFSAYSAIKSIVNLEFKTTNPRMWATGPGTRDALLALAVPVDLIDSPDSGALQFDSEALWDIVKQQIKPGEKALIVRGSSVNIGNGGAAEFAKMNGRPWLANQLLAAGVQVDEVVSYERRAPVFDSDELALLRQASAGKCIWLLSSSEAVANLCKVFGLDSGINWTNAKAIATHPRIAQAAKDAGFGVVYESRPLLTDVVASIESLL